MCARWQVTGESGAGKTETAKLIMACLAHLGQGAHEAPSSSHGGMSGVEQKVKGALAHGEEARGGGPGGGSALAVPAAATRVKVAVRCSLHLCSLSSPQKLDQHPCGPTRALLADPLQWAAPCLWLLSSPTDPRVQPAARGLRQCQDGALRCLAMPAPCVCTAKRCPDCKDMRLHDHHQHPHATTPAGGLAVRDCFWPVPGCL